MKIAFVSVYSFDSSMGGLENHIFYIMKELIAFGHEVALYQPSCEVHQRQVVIERGLTIIRLPVREGGLLRKFFERINKDRFGFLSAYLIKSRFLFSARSIARQILKDSPDLVHQHDFTSTVFATKIISKNIPCVLTNHTGEYLFYMKSRIGRLFLQYMLRHFSFVIGPSKELTPRFLKKGRVMTVFNGVDKEKFNTNYAKKRVREELGLPLDKKIILCPRRWAPTKGIVYLMSAIKKHKLDKKYLFVFAGSDYSDYPNYKAEVEQVYDGVENKKNVCLVGNLNNEQMVEYIQASDLVVIPSLMEAVSLSAVEAMACQVPVLSSDVGGMSELIVDGRNGYLVPARDSDILASRIDEIFSDASKMEMIARAASQSVKHFTWQEISKVVAGVYEKVLVEFEEASVNTLKQNIS